MTDQTEATPDLSADDMLREIWLSQARHTLAMLKAPPGTLKAAQLEACRKFLADSGINAATFTKGVLADALAGLEDLPFKT